MYSSVEEEEAIKLIYQLFGGSVTILNPRDYDENPDFARMKRDQGLAVCFRLIDQSDCVIFQRFHLNEQFKMYVLEYIEHADEYGDYKAHLENSFKDVSRKLQKLIMNKSSLTTPGVAKEVDYAIKSGKEVYELSSGKLIPWAKRLRSDFKGPNDPLYRTLSLLLKAFKDGMYERLLPPFWWLYKERP
jgi:hypothetical protein